MNNKKLLVLALGATLSFGTIASADTVDLGYGQQANTSMTVKAVKLDGISTNPKERSGADKKVLKELNKEIQVGYNDKISVLGVKGATPFKGNFADGYTLYQLSGDNAMGHNTAWLLTYNVSKDVINHIARDFGHVNADRSGKHADLYTKAYVEEGLQKIKPYAAEGAALKMIVAEKNADFHRSVMHHIDQAMDKEKGWTMAEKTEMKGFLNGLVNKLSVDATSVSLTAGQSKYGTMALGNYRGSINYDGFTWPGSISVYGWPTDAGVTVQILATEDTSHDYWQGELNTMYGVTAQTGGN